MISDDRPRVSHSSPRWQVMDHHRVVNFISLAGPQFLGENAARLEKAEKIDEKPHG